MKVFAIYNIKGGVGKTTTSVNLAYLAARSGARTLIWDLDPQGAASYCFRIKAKVSGGGSKLLRGKSDVDALIKGTDYERLDLLPADFSYRHFDLVISDAKQPTSLLSKTLKSLRDDYDYVFLDCPPSISTLSEAVFHAADQLIVPTLPSVLSLRTLKKLFEFRKEHKLKKMKVLAFLTMVDRRKKLHNHVAQAWPEMGKWALKANVPYASEIEQMAERRQPLPCFAARGRAAEAYQALWSEIEQRVRR
ncbi:MAG: ParA family protein [Mariprofundus sp.]